MHPEALELLACPRCEGALDEALHCGRCGERWTEEHGVANLRVAGGERTEAVRAFYAHAPFPGYPQRDSPAWLRARAERSDFARLLDQSIPTDARVLELGCGTGQMSLYLATGERWVVGADLARPSLAMAESARRRYGVERAVFVETDLHAPGLRRGAFDVVYSSGVLHHTPDPRAAFASLAKLVRPGGMVVLGLYSAYARLPHRLRRAFARLTRFRYVPFDPVLRERAAEPARREAWLRDQYLHIEEHRHTLAEVRRWFRENRVRYLRAYPETSLAPAEEPDALFSPAADDWPFENFLAQLSWAFTLGREGGLFVTIGQAAP